MEKMGFTNFRHEYLLQNYYTCSWQAANIFTFKHASMQISKRTLALFQAQRPNSIMRLPVTLGQT